MCLYSVWSNYHFTSPNPGTKYLDLLLFETFRLNSDWTIAPVFENKGSVVILKFVDTHILKTCAYKYSLF